MIKYFHFARIALGDHLNNRLRQLTRFMVFMVLAWAVTSMWRILYQSGRVPENLPEIDMLWYAGLTQMIFFLSPRIFAVVDDDVRSGNIGYFLNRPMPYLWMRFAEGFGALSGNILIYYICAVPFLYFLIGGWPTQGAGVLGPILVLIASASALHLLFQMACGLSAFWLNDAIFIYFAYQKMLIVLGGIYAPLMFYPAFFAPEVLKFLPFAAMIHNSVVTVLPGQESHFGELFLLQMFWTGAAVLSVTALYNICLRKVEIHGG